MSKPIISPSILSANFLNIQADIETLNRSEADWVHVDGEMIGLLIIDYFLNLIDNAKIAIF